MSQPRDTTDIDLLDKERENIAKQRAASYSQKEFKVHNTYTIPEGLNITDTATATDADQADLTLAEGLNITDDVTDSAVIATAKYSYGDDGGSLEPLIYGFGVYKA